MGLLSDIKSRKGKKSKKNVLPEAEPIEEKVECDEICPKDDLYVKAPSMEVDQLIYLPLPDDRYGKKEFDPEPPHKIQVMSPKGFNLAMECMKHDHEGEVPYYADQFVRTCLYGKNLEIHALIEFYRTYPDYSGLRRELIFKMRTDGNFEDVAKLSKSISSAKGLEDRVIDKAEREISSAVADYIKSHNSYNYVESLFSDKNVSECHLRKAFSNSDDKTNPLCVLMMDALCGMMDSCPDSETLNMIYFGTFSKMKKDYGQESFDDKTISCYWKNLTRFMKSETDVRHFGDMLRDAMQGKYPKQKEYFSSEVSNQYARSINTLVVVPVMDGNMSFEVLRKDALLALHMSKYCNNIPSEVKDAVKDAIVKAISMKLSQNTTVDDMSKAYSLVLSYIPDYNDVFNVQITEKDVGKAYEEMMIGKVRDSDKLSDSNMWYLHATPRVRNSEMDEAMLKAYCKAMGASKTMDDLFNSYSKIEDPIIRDAGASEFAAEFYNRIEDRSYDEYAKFISRLDDFTRKETLLCMGNNYTCDDSNISQSLLDEARELQNNDSRFRQATIFQSELLIELFLDSRYDGMFSGYDIIDPDSASYYADLLNVNGNYMDDLLALCVLMEHSGLQSKLLEVFGNIPWYNVCMRDTRRDLLLGCDQSFFTDDQKSLKERITSVQNYVNALASANLELTDSVRFLTYVSDSIGAICESFGSETPLELSKSLYDYMHENDIPCMNALLSYAFVLVLEGRYRDLPEIDDETVMKYPDECALYKYVCDYMEWFGTCSAEKVGRFPLDIDVPLKHAHTDFHVAMIYFIRSEVSQFFGNGSLVYDGWRAIVKRCKDKDVYTLLMNKISIMAFKYRIFEGNLDNSVVFDSAMGFIEPINNPELKKLLQVYGSYVGVASDSRGDSNEVIDLTRSVRSMIDNNSGSKEFNAALYYINGCLLVISKRSGAIKEFNKALDNLSDSVLAWEGWPRSEPKRAQDIHINPVELSVLYAEIKHCMGLSKRDMGENYHDDMIDALEKLYDCPKSECLAALKAKIESDNMAKDKTADAKVEKNEGSRMKKAFDSGSAHYLFEVSPMASGGHYSIHYGHRMSEYGTEETECVMKVPKGVKFLSTATMTQDDEAIMQFDREIECWDILSSECPDKVVTLLDHGKSPHMFSISQYADATLKDVMLNMNRKQILSAMENVLGALAKIHELGLIYNDLTPDNIMRVENSWKLNDFDSVTVEGEDPIVNRHTLLYNSPEQATNGRITSKSDIWAAGVVLYEALFKGKRPFDNQDSIVKMKFDDSRTVKTAYDELFKKIFTVPEERPSATELINILKEIENKEM